MMDDETALRKTVQAYLQKELGEDFFPKLYSRDGPLVMVTELSREEIADLAYAMWFAGYSEDENLKEVATLWLASKVSYRRKGRAEAVKALIGGVEKRVRKWWDLRRAEG